MEPSEKIQKLQEEEKRNIQSLRSGNKKVIIDTISSIRKRGKTSILPEVFELMLLTEDKEVMEAAVTFLNDLKKKEVIPVMIDAISDKNYQGIRKELIASCWQSGLDYHKNIMIFMNIALKDDYASAFEAFTVIEDCIGDISDAERARCVKKLNKGLEKTSEEKLPLIKELISMVESF
ncbi:MAG: HEAT repeat domain-containing protein [Bacteroidales bacterium]|nr:HEAT repeat domain-containing protein [Bacteroidales bacterium]